MERDINCLSQLPTGLNELLISPSRRGLPECSFQDGHFTNLPSSLTKLFLPLGTYTTKLFDQLPPGIAYVEFARPHSTLVEAREKMWQNPVWEGCTLPFNEQSYVF